MLLPVTLAIAKSVLPFIVANKLTINSGAEVPNATIVRPTTSADTPNRNANEDAPETSQSAPLMSKKNPTKNRSVVIIL